MELAGSVALVTGSARRIGKAIALDLARAGASIAVHYSRSAEEAGNVVRELNELGVAAAALQADLADPLAIAGLLSSVESEFGRLDVLVNSAASFQRERFAEITPGSWDEVLAVNLRAPFFLSQRAAPLIRRSPRGGQPGLVVNVADLSGVQAWRNYAHHSVSKAGLLHLTRIVARELAPDIRAVALVLGAMLPPAGQDLDDEAWDALGRRVPLQRTGELRQAGEAVVFIAGNDYITGTTIYVDGGQHLVGPHAR